MPKRRALIVVLLLALPAARPALGACQEALVKEPAVGATVSDARPVLRWDSLAGDGPYRVEIESRVPEGGVLLSVDTLVAGTSFRPPRPLTDQRAAVKVRVSQGCPADDGSTLREKPALFQIDTGPGCPVPTSITMSADGRFLEWTPVPGALRYEVSFRDPKDGSPRLAGESKGTRYPLPAASSTAIAFVRPYCATGFGPRGSALIAPPKP